MENEGGGMEMREGGGNEGWEIKGYEGRGRKISFKIMICNM